MENVAATMIHYTYQRLAPKVQSELRGLATTPTDRQTSVHKRRPDNEATRTAISPCSPWWPFPYLGGVGLVLLLHSFRSRATSWVTPTPAMSSFICWCHIFLGRPRRLVPGIASSRTAISLQKNEEIQNDRRLLVH